jgi:general secretion pathway protein C
LSGTFYNARFPQKSFASFHVRPEHPGGEVYRVGERVGAFAILSVGARTVVLDDGGPGCYLKLAGASVTPPTAPAKPPRKKRREKKPAPAPEPASDSGGFTPEELNEAIRSLGGNKYEIKKDLLPKIAARSAQLRSTTHWQQVRGYSNVLGMRLEKIESNGLFEKLGLQPGDLVKTLNGLQLSSLDGALEAQKLVSSAKNLSLLVQRDGTPITLEYRIVP